MLGFFPPYRNVQHHLQDFRRSGRSCQMKEIFNYGHSSLRNVIKKHFSVLKKQLPILKTMTPYSFDTQVFIVIIECTIHKFI